MYMAEVRLHVVRDKKLMRCPGLLIMPILRTGPFRTEHFDFTRAYYLNSAHTIDATQDDSVADADTSYPGQFLHRIKAPESLCGNMRSQWTEEDEKGFKSVFGHGTPPFPPTPGMPKVKYQVANPLATKAPW